MKTSQKRKTILHRPSRRYQGTRPPLVNQGGVEKWATGQNSSHNDLDGNQNRHSSNLGPPESTSIVTRPVKPQQRQKWSREEYKEILYCFYYALENPSKTCTTERTYNLWRERNKQDREYIDANKLANIRRDILKKKRISDAEIYEIKEEVKTIIKKIKNDLRIRDGQTKVKKDKESDDEEIFLGFDDDGEAVMLKQCHVVVKDINQEENKVCENGTLIEQETKTNSWNQEIESIKESILNELGVVQEMDIKDRESLNKVRINKKAKTLIEYGNMAFEAIIQELCPDLTTYNQLLYATGKVITNMCSERKKKKKKKNPHRQQKPKWKERIEKEIELMRGELSILTELQRGVNVKGKACRTMKRKYKIEKDNINTVKETIKQRMQLKAQRLRRYEKRNKFYRQNMIFKTDAKKFYREIGKETIMIDKTPSVEEMENFWRTIWSEEKEFNEQAEWIKNTEQQNEMKNQQEWREISTDELKQALIRSHKWKSPGIDRIPNFWLNCISKGHNRLASLLSELVENPETAPEWMTEGVTYLLPKNKDTKNPKNYRPITCLTTTYKILTSILSERTYTFIENNEVFPLEQKGCKKGSYGCKDQLLINKMLLEHCKSKHRNMSMAWIDYKKAFDSVPHSWIIKSLELFKVSPIIVNF